MAPVDSASTALTRARYNRNARLYDLMTRGLEANLALARTALWRDVGGPRVLEVGVGTGVNMPLYPSGIATCVSCSVPDPMLGLGELRRVLLPGGQLLLLEHVLSQRPLLRQLMRLMNPLVVRLMGANIDRDTVSNVRLAGFAELVERNLILDVFKRITARKEVVSLSHMPQSNNPVLLRGGTNS